MVRPGRVPEGPPGTTDPPQTSPSPADRLLRAAGVAPIVGVRGAGGPRCGRPLGARRPMGASGTEPGAASPRGGIGSNLHALHAEQPPRERLCRSGRRLVGAVRGIRALAWSGIWRMRAFGRHRPPAPREHSTARRASHHSTGAPGALGGPSECQQTYGLHRECRPTLAPAAPGLLMDARGVVSMGEWAGHRRWLPIAQGVCVDVPGNRGTFERVAKRADVWPLSLATSRLAAAGRDATEAAAAARWALARLDTLVGARAHRSGQTTFILLTCTAGSPRRREGDPLFIVGTDGARSPAFRDDTPAGLVATISRHTGGPAGRWRCRGCGAPLSWWRTGSGPTPVVDSARRVARLHFRVFRSWAVLMGPRCNGPLLLGCGPMRRRAAWSSGSAGPDGALSLPAGALLVSGFAADTLGE